MPTINEAKKENNQEHTMTNIIRYAISTLLVQLYLIQASFIFSLFLTKTG